MTANKVYEDIALRTGGDIYVGVVGPVRTGKSTFIKRFMETLVIPNIDNVYQRERARDELPQSGSGRTVMTAEPKFVPEEAVNITLSSGASMSVRMIDCVGYMVDGATGLTEDGEDRTVATPWFDYEVDIKTAAEEGTRRVIREHSTIGLVVTTDGSICGLPRDSYIAAEEQVVLELKELGKPFLIVLNCTEPNTPHSRELAQELSEKYGVGCMPVSCLTMGESDIEAIMRRLLGEFAVEEYGVFLPEWAESLPPEHELLRSIFAEIIASSAEVSRIRDIERLACRMGEMDCVSGARCGDIEMSTGSFSVHLDLPREIYYRTLSGQCGMEINSDRDLISILSVFSSMRAEYDKVAAALRDVRDRGYGVVMPTAAQMQLQEPEIVRRGGKYSVVLRASAPAIHMMMTSVETEVTPAVGGESASEEILGFLLQNYEGDPAKIWESNIFGKSLYEIAGESLEAKLTKMPQSAGHKMRSALQRIVNEGRGGLICIIF